MLLGFGEIDLFFYKRMNDNNRIQIINFNSMFAYKFVNNTFNDKHTPCIKLKFMIW